MSTEDPKERFYTTGDLARLTGTTLRTVRYYESVGLLNPAERSDGGHRLFTEADVARLRTISDLRTVGICLEDVARVLHLGEHAPDHQDHLQRIAQVLDEQLATVRERMAMLTRVEHDLSAARQIVNKCLTCDQPAESRPCGRCETYRLNKPNPWVNTMLTPHPDTTKR